MPVTFGFELEYVSHVNELATELHRRRIMPMDQMHDYHCRCEQCSDWEFPLRAQRDSSCGGELISGVQSTDDWRQATDLMLQIQEAAVDVDAATSLSCGMHVHLGWIDMSRGAVTTKYNLVAAWLGLEPFLWEHIASGVWGRPRSSNQRISSLLFGRINGSAYSMFEGNLCSWDMSFDQLRNSPLLSDYAWDDVMRLATEHLAQMDWDRHSDLTQTQRGGRYEVRIFNATRMAWRMELACRLSVALLDRRVGNAFASDWREFCSDRERCVAYVIADPPLLTESDWPISTERAITVFGDADPRLGELLGKQIPYSKARHEVGPLSGHVNNAIFRASGHADVLAALAAANQPAIVNDPVPSLAV